MPKQQFETIQLQESKSPLGESPAKLAKREIVKPKLWCPKPNIEFDSWCDPDNPKTITFKEICKASHFISKQFPKTPLEKSKCCTEIGMNLYYKFEIFHRTGSFLERGAFYSLTMLTKEQRDGGVYSSSLGNWALALAYYGQMLKIRIILVLPMFTAPNIVTKCQVDFGATVILLGSNLDEAKKHAFTIIAESGTGTFINGYDHPNVIAASGTIGLEILEQCPDLDAIILPIGGGGLIAGVASAVKQIRPNALIYGVQTEKSCSYYKAIKNDFPYKAIVVHNLAATLAVPTAGYNAFHTAQSLIDKVVLVNDDKICTGILHMVEKERYIVEGAGATGLGALLTNPNILPELQDKNVVCVITGGNIDWFTLTRSMERAKAIDGRLVKMTATLQGNDPTTQLKVLRMIANLGGNILRNNTEGVWIDEGLLTKITFIIETKDLVHVGTLKRVMETVFPGVCKFSDEPFSPISKCACFSGKNP